MTDFKDFFTKTEKEDTSFTSVNTVGGSFMCQECTEIVDRAYVRHAEGKLVWLCSEGHKSSINWS